MNHICLLHELSVCRIMSALKKNIFFARRISFLFVYVIYSEVPCRKILRNVKDPLRYLRY
jgi:hypothetical protein